MCPPIDYINGPHYTPFVYDAEMVTQDELKLSSILQVPLLSEKISRSIHPSHEDEMLVFIFASLD